MAHPLYPDVHARDDVAQGRVIFLGIILAYLCLFSLVYLGAPYILVPGCFYDRTFDVASRLINLAIQYGLFGVFTLLMWAGIGWIRYVFAVYLFLAGMAMGILSISMEAYGGLPLLLAFIEIASAAALALSVPLHRFVAHQRQAPSPWLALGLLSLLLLAVPIALVTWDLVDAQLVIRKEKEQCAFAADRITQLATHLDLNILKPDATDTFLKNLADPTNLAAWQEFVDDQGSFGGIKSIDPPLPEAPSTLILNPPRHGSRAFMGRVHYAKQDVIFVLTLKEGGAITSIADLSWQIFPKSGEK